MSFSDLSDREINKLVFESTNIFGFVSSGIPYQFREIRCTACGDIDLNEKEFDPCNSWADAGPIIQKNRIPLNPFRNEWVSGERRIVKDKNPLRAAMIVFLMMKGGK